MTKQTASLEYRRAATQQASVVGLVIALHDTLIGDLKRAADAMDRMNIQERCNQLAHGFKVLQQLELMVDMDHGGETAIKLRRFYGHVREQMMRAQFKLKSEILRVQIRSVLEVREAWQQLDGSPLDSSKASPGYAEATAASTDRSSNAGARLSFSCSC